MITNILITVCLVQPPTAHTLHSAEWRDDQTGNDGRDSGMSSATVPVPGKA